MELLEGREIRTRSSKERADETEERVVINRVEGGEEENEKQEDKKTEELESHEIGKAVLKMKMDKAAGIDGIQMEAWRYGGEEIKKGLEELLRKIWKEDQIPEDWKSSIIVPIYKRGDHEKVGNYRGIPLLCSAYKIYAEILRNRLEEKVDEKGMTPISQAGFRKGKSTLDNIFVLNHIIQRKGVNKKKSPKVYALFIDLKAAFDNVDRKILWKVMENKDIDKKLLKRIKGLYEETNGMVRTKEGLTEKFRMEKGVKQSCVISYLTCTLRI